MTRSPRRRGMVLGAFLWASSGAAALLALFTQMALARHLPPDEFGQIASLLALYAIVGALGHFGLGNLLIRKYAEAPAQSAAWARGAIRVAIAISLLTSSAMLAAAAVTGWSSHALGLLMLPVAFSYTFSELAIARYQLLERMRSIAGLQCSPNLMRFLFVVVAIQLAAGPLHVAAALGLASACTAAVALLRYLRSVGPVGDVPAVSPGLVLAQVWPYGLSMVVYVAYSQGGVLLLRWANSAESAGHFALAVNLLAAVYLLPIAIFQRLNAKQVAIWSAGASVRLRPYLKKVTGGSLVVGAVIAAALALLADPLVRLLFGAGYDGASRLLGVLSFAIPFRFAATAAGATLNSYDDTRLRLVIQVSTFAAYLLLSWALVRLEGSHLSIAIAMAFVLCEAVLCGLYVRSAWVKAGVGR